MRTGLLNPQKSILSAVKMTQELHRHNLIQRLLELNSSSPCLADDLKKKNHIWKEISELEI